MITKSKLHGRRFAWPWLVVLGAGMTAFGAGSAMADKKEFLGRQKMYLSFEITETGSREFGVGTPKNAITDGAHRTNRSVKFEMPLEMPMPGSFPMSSMPMSQEEMIEQDRFIGWMAAPPDGSEAEEALTTGKLDYAKSPMFVPAEFSVDDVSQFRYRDDPAAGWGTNTTTSKGRGSVYLMKSGMLMCDLKKMTCDINNVSLSYTDGSDVVTVSTTSDVAGFEPKREASGPRLHLPNPSPELVKRLTGFAITLSDPMTVTFSGSPVSASDGEGEGSNVTIKVTMSSRPAAKAAGSSR
ncbi:MAG TPA: hypothetical protein VFG76_02515 [Candidatus Polarisedimenticolia bacterium]|nr:hypothetical protein [Candidatus Polarisedimenticolia bacterium]